MALIPSPPVNGIHIGPAFIHVYGLMYLVGIALATWITSRFRRAERADLNCSLRRSAVRDALAP
jgi:prolipoprotein diacylglyceryltransferase